MDMSDTKLFISLKKTKFTLFFYPKEKKQDLPCQPWEWPDENAPFAWVETNSWEGLHGPLIARWRTAAPKSCQNWAPFHTWVTDETIFGHGIEVIAIRRPYLQRKYNFTLLISPYYTYYSQKKHASLGDGSFTKTSIYKVKFSTISK